VTLIDLNQDRLKPNDSQKLAFKCELLVGNARTLRIYPFPGAVNEVGFVSQLELRNIGQKDIKILELKVIEPDRLGAPTLTLANYEEPQTWFKIDSQESLSFELQTHLQVLEIALIARNIGLDTIRLESELEIVLTISQGNRTHT